MLSLFTKKAQGEEDQAEFTGENEDSVLMMTRIENYGIITSLMLGQTGNNFGRVRIARKNPHFQ